MAARKDRHQRLIGHAPFRLTGNAQMNTAAGTLDASKVHVDFDLATDRFVVPSTKTAVATFGGGSFAVIAFAAPSITLDPSLDEPLLPLDLVRKTDWNGKLAIGQLVYEGATFDRASISLQQRFRRDRRKRRSAAVLRRHRRDDVEDRRTRRDAAVERSRRS